MKELKRKENKEVKPQELVFLFFFVFLLSGAREVEWKEIGMEKILTIGVAVDWGRKWGNLYYFWLFFLNGDFRLSSDLLGKNMRGKDELQPWTLSNIFSATIYLSPLSPFPFLRKMTRKTSFGRDQQRPSLSLNLGRHLFCDHIYLPPFLLSIKTHLPNYQNKWQIYISDFDISFSITLTNVTLSNQTMP